MDGSCRESGGILEHAPTQTDLAAAASAATGFLRDSPVRPLSRTTQAGRSLGDDQFAAVLGALNVGVGCFAADGTVVMCTSRFRWLTGCDRGVGLPESFVCTLAARVSAAPGAVTGTWTVRPAVANAMPRRLRYVAWPQQAENGDRLVRIALIDANAELRAVERVEHLRTIDNATGLRNEEALRQFIRQQLVHVGEWPILAVALHGLSPAVSDDGASLYRRRRIGNSLAELGRHHGMRVFADPTSLIYLSPTTARRQAWSPIGVFNALERVVAREFKGKIQATGVGLVVDRHAQSLPLELRLARFVLAEHCPSCGTLPLVLDGEVRQEALRHLNSCVGALNALDRPIGQRDAFGAGLIVAAQPKVELSSRRILGEELLVRYQSADRVVSAPSAFLRFLQREDELLRLTKGILIFALERITRKVVRGETCSVSVNVPASFLVDRDATAWLQNEIRQRDIPAQALTLELTETEKLGDVRHGADTLRDLRSAGARISLDDFGTAYASLQWVLQLPFDELKVDRCFVRDAAHDRAAESLVRVCAALADGHGATCVAEGVETEEDHALMQRLGVVVGQGYLYGKPKLLAE